MFGGKRVSVLVGFLLLGSVLVCLVPAALRAADFYVATNGADANPGTMTSPYLTFAQAQAAVRSALPSASEPIHVWVRGGTYHLKQPLAFGPEDSGTAAAPVTYAAYSGETVVVSGAILLNPAWSPYTSNPHIMVANIGTNLDIDGLFINGEPQVLARYPNYDANQVVLNGYAPDAIGTNRVARWSNPTTGLVRGLHGGRWGGNSFKITGVASNGQPALQWVGDNNRGSSLNKTYRLVENIFEELDTTNEWFYDKNGGNLYYYPPAGLDLAHATVEAAALSELVGFCGAATNQPVTHITLSHFIFTQTHRTLFNTPYEGLMRGDWAVARAGAIFMSNAESLVVQGCLFTNLGGNGIFMSGYNRHHVVNDNDFVNLGATCVQIVGLQRATRYPSTWENPHSDILDTNAGPATADYPAEITVSSNYMYNLGVIEKQSAGVNMSVSESITVSHNTIHRSPRSGINVNDGCFGGHVIEFNDVWDCVRETSDHGPFNSWGRDRFYTYKSADGGHAGSKRASAFLDCWKPVVLRNNRFQYPDVQTWGIDLDDGSSHFEIYNNVCLNTGFKLRDGFSRHVYNNIVINQGGNFHVWLDDCQDHVDHNIIINAAPWTLIGLNAKNLPTKHVLIDTNFFWNGGQAIKLPFANWTSAGYDAHSLTVDPQFKNPAANDFTVQNPAILAAGFVNFPMDQFGANRPGVPTAPPVAILAAVAAADSGNVSHFMGAAISDINSDGIVSATGMTDRDGVYFESVPAGCAAAKQGFKANDVVLKVNGTAITGVSSFLKAVSQAAAGQSVPAILWRNQTALPFEFIPSK